MKRLAAIRVPYTLGVGVDIQNVSRLEKLVNRSQYAHDRFLTGVLHPNEIEEYKQKEVDRAKYEYLASRWALKEAMVKASGIRGLRYPGIWLKKVKGQKPKLTISGDHNEKLIYDELKVTEIHSSISHEETHAIAYVSLQAEKLVPIEEISIPEDDKNQAIQKEINNIDRPV